MSKKKGGGDLGPGAGRSMDACVGSKIQGQARGVAGRTLAGPGGRAQAGQSPPRLMGAGPTGRCFGRKGLRGVGKV